LTIEDVKALYNKRNLGNGSFYLINKSLRKRKKKSISALPAISVCGI
jgi:hypothetical protein